MDRFIRANSRAVITVSHDYHGDTEYRYDVVGSGDLATITAWASQWEDETKKWDAFFTGTIQEFIRVYGKS